MAESYRKNGGDGAHSYTENSQSQKQSSDSATDLMKDAIIEKLDMEILLPVSTTFNIVDFGCSVGPNTFLAVQNLIEAVEEKCSLQGLESGKIEFQVFFNDQTGNDFNTLFASLPPERQYHAAGAPGSFYSRRFPRASISLAHSAYCLNWLSEVPEGVSNSRSTAWNEGKIFYTGSSEQVVKAYADQFEKDMGSFMSARAEEIVGGGLMLLILPGTPDGVSHAQFPLGLVFNVIGSCLMDLATEGIIDKAEVDAFNLPMYFTTTGEMRQVIEKNGCFSIETIEMRNPTPQGNYVPPDGHSMIKHMRAGMGEVIFTKHFASNVVEKMFEKALERSDEIRECLVSGYSMPTQLFVVLKRK